QVTLPAHVLPGTSVVARASVLHDGPGNTRLKVYDGDRFLGSRDVALGDGDGEQSVPISFTLDQPGERVLTFSLEPKSEERELRNNTQVHTLQVRAARSSRLRVCGWCRCCARAPTATTVRASIRRRSCVTDSRRTPRPSTPMTR